VVAAEVKVVNGIITSDLVDVPTGTGKATALKRIGLTHPDAVFGNSLHDLAMLEMARCPFPVNPSPALIAEAGKRGWGYFKPQTAESVHTVVNGE
jgi:phosphoserine phosphatase